MYPKRKQNVNTAPLPIGKQRVKDLIAGTDFKTMYLPKSIIIENIDASVYNLFNSEEFRLTIDQKMIPIIYMSNERWGEFEKTWQYQDSESNILPPFTIVKRVDSPEKGTIWGTVYNYAQRKLFKYIDIPTLEDGHIIFTRYKIPQAAPIDLTYEVSMFSMYQLDENVFDEKMINKFSSRQVYATHAGNYFPIVVEGTTNSDEIDDVDGQRLYISTFTIKVMAYIQDENDFEITKTIKRPIVNYDIIENNSRIDMSKRTTETEWYYGKYNSIGGIVEIPNENDIIIDNGVLVSAVISSGKFIIPFNSFVDDFIWFAIPVSSGLKSSWYVTLINQGLIGGPISRFGNLFPDPVIVNYNGIEMYLYISSARTNVVQMIIG